LSTADRAGDQALEPAAARASAATTAGSIFALLLEYMKTVAAEQHEAAKLARAALALAIETKAAELRRDNAAIDKGMEEAREKADLAMDQASFEMFIGICSGLIAGDTRAQVDQLAHDLEALKNEVHRIRTKLGDEDDDDD